jgi:hypothetical protein
MVYDLTSMIATQPRIDRNELPQARIWKHIFASGFNACVELPVLMLSPSQQLLELPLTVTESRTCCPGGSNLVHQDWSPTPCTWLWPKNLPRHTGRYRYALPLLFHSSCAEHKRSTSQYVLMKIIKGTEEETMAYIHGSCY